MEPDHKASMGGWDNSLAHLAASRVKCHVKLSDEQGTLT